jgi:hypothetical protein
MRRGVTRQKIFKSCIQWSKSSDRLAESISQLLTKFKSENDPST